METTTKEQAHEAIAIAQFHAPMARMASSAKLCVDDAVDLYNAGSYAYAYKRACESLKYSVGNFHPFFGAK